MGLEKKSLFNDTQTSMFLKGSSYGTSCSDLKDLGTACNKTIDHGLVIPNDVYVHKPSFKVNHTLKSLPSDQTQIISVLTYNILLHFGGAYNTAIAPNFKLLFDMINIEFVQFSVVPHLSLALNSVFWLLSVTLYRLRKAGVWHMVSAGTDEFSHTIQFPFSRQAGIWSWPF